MSESYGSGEVLWRKLTWYYGGEARTSSRKVWLGIMLLKEKPSTITFLNVHFLTLHLPVCIPHPLCLRHYSMSMLLTPDTSFHLLGHLPYSICVSVMRHLRMLANCEVYSSCHFDGCGVSSAQCRHLERHTR